MIIPFKPQFILYIHTKATHLLEYFVPNYILNVHMSRKDKESTNQWQKC